MHSVSICVSIRFVGYSEFLLYVIVEYPKFVDKSIFGILAMFWRIPRPGYVTREATRILSLSDKSLVEYVFQTANLHLILYVLSIFLLILLILYFNNVIVEN